MTPEDIREWIDEGAGNQRFTNCEWQMLVALADVAEAGKTIPAHLSLQLSVALARVEALKL